jgi:hypothetical protein
MTTTRTIQTTGTDDTLQIIGLTQGPAGGWRWDADSGALNHHMGYRLTFAPEAARRIAEALSAARPAVTSGRLTGYQVNQLAEEERAGYKYAGTSEDGAIGYYVKYTPPVLVDVEFDTAEVASLTQAR